MTNLNTRWQTAFSTLPLIAILRGIKTSEAVEVADTLYSAGFRIIEVPLNSPDPYATIEAMAAAASADVIIGAGTVLSAESVQSSTNAGASLIVAPNLNSAVAEAATSRSTIYCPGIATPSEAFSALELGATALKLFPAEMLGPPVVSALRAVLPPDALLLPVGGITPENMSAYRSAGVNGFGIGSALYKPGKSIDAIQVSAQEFIRNW